MEKLCNDVFQQVQKEYRAAPVTLSVKSLTQEKAKKSKIRLKEYLKEIFDKNYDKKIQA